MSVECNKIRSPNENRKHRETKILKLDPVFLSKIYNVPLFVGYLTTFFFQNNNNWAPHNHL
jgi:hypothetical protein